MINPLRRQRAVNNAVRRRAASRLSSLDRPVDEGEVVVTIASDNAGRQIAGVTKKSSEKSVKLSAAKEGIAAARIRTDP